MIMTTLVLLPMTALAHAATSTEPQPSSSSATVTAELKTPAAISLVTAGSATHPAVHLIVQTKMSDDDFIESEMRKGGTLAYAFYGSVPTEFSAPSVTRAVEVGLTTDEMAMQPAVTRVVVHAVVDSYGFPRNLTIEKSAGAMVDHKVLAAVGQYRFKPATLDNRPVDSAVTISVQITKP
jgi:hypothetical protein